jgi:transposase InsO family protein
MCAAGARLPITLAYDQGRRDAESEAGELLLRALSAATPAKAAPSVTWDDAERFVRSIKSECLERVIFFSEAALARAIEAYAAHYHQERNHQGVGNRLLEPGPEVGRSSGPIECRQRLGGLLRYYYRGAA